MPDCCPKCFGDRHLEKIAFVGKSPVSAECDYCGSTGQPLIRPSELRDLFELVLGAYRRDDAGKVLLYWLRKDWLLFNTGTIDDRKATELLAAIFESPPIVKEKFSPDHESEEAALQMWAALRKELMHNNRYFPETPLDRERLGELLGYLEESTRNSVEHWFRARIQKDGHPYKAEDMGAPPAKRATHGRANPAGIPYLYLASNVDTAVSEIRPHTGEKATVAKFHFNEELNVVDLQHPRSAVSPFMLADESEIRLLRGDLGLLEKLGEELTMPVAPESFATDYVPSQYLCEFIKRAGYDGVLYRSSVGDGINLALFNTQLGAIEAVEQHIVAKVSVEIEPDPTDRPSS